MVKRLPAAILLGLGLAACQSAAYAFQPSDTLRLIRGMTETDVAAITGSPGSTAS